MPALRGRDGWRTGAWKILRALKLRMALMVGYTLLPLSKPVECLTSRVKSKVNYAAWVIMMCHCKFTSYNKCTTLGDNVNIGGVYA